MPQIFQIVLHTQTGDLEDAGTDDDVYLGVCGREFHCDSASDDFERGSAATYVFGENANVSNPDLNDPRDHLLLTENVESLPTYLRFQGDDHWFLDRAGFYFNGEVFPQWDTASYLRGGIWLGPRAGMYVHIPKHKD